MRFASSALLLAFAAVVHSAAVLQVSRQTKSAKGIGSKRFILVAETEGSSCPQNITHGEKDFPPLFGKRPNIGIEASLNFSNIVADGAICSGGALVLLSQDELGRLNAPAANFLQLSDFAWDRVFTAGFDTRRRMCGDYKAAAPAYYAYIKEIDSFKPSLLKVGLNIPDLVSVSGERWMVSYIPSLKQACAYIDTTSPSFDRAKKAGLPFVKPAPPAVNQDLPPADVQLAESSPEASPDLITDSLGPEPSSLPVRNSSGRACFPASATVELEDGSIKEMSEVEIGDQVKVSEGVFSEVFMFTHKLSNVNYDFVTIKTSCGATLALTHGHYLYVNGALVPASSVHVGDFVQSAAGESLAVSSVGISSMTGLYNPQTVHGDIAVNGIRSSTYTTAVHPDAAHAMLSPLRGIYSKFGLFTSSLHNGADFFVSILPGGGSMMA